MNDTNNSLTWLDQLSTEIILDIFDYLSSNDILYAFFYFNQQFNTILLQHRPYLNNIEISRVNSNFFQKIFPIIASEIHCLNISTIDFSFPLNFFPNLKSIILSSVSFGFEELDFILNNEQFNKLNLFKIRGQLFGQEEHCVQLKRTIRDKILNNQNILETFECSIVLPLDDFIYMYITLSINMNLQSLSIKSIDLKDGLSILEYTPNLKSFSLTTSLLKQFDIKLLADLSTINLEKFYFTYERDTGRGEIGGNGLFLLINIVKQFSSSLTYLSINLSDGYFYPSDKFGLNGIQLQELLLEPMIELKQFHLYAEIIFTLGDEKEFLSTFENQFWIDHNWSIGIYQKYVFTLPFHFDKLNGFVDFNHVKSNNLNLLNSPWIWYHITSINLSSSWNWNLNFIKQIKIKIPNLKSITFNSFYLSDFPPVDDSDWNDDKLRKFFQRIDSVTTIHFRRQSIDNIIQWLFDITPNVKEVSALNVTSSNGDKIVGMFVHFTESEDYVYSPNVEHVEIEFWMNEESISNRYVSYRLMKILEIYQNSKMLTFYFHLDSRKQDSTNIIMDNLVKIIADLQIEKILNNYQMTSKYNYLQFLKKEYLINC